MTVRLAKVLESFVKSPFIASLDDEHIEPMISLLESAYDDDEVFTSFKTFAGKHKPENALTAEISPQISTDAVNPFIIYSAAGADDESAHDDAIFVVLAVGPFTHKGEPFFGSYIYKETQGEYGDTLVDDLEVCIAERTPHNCRELQKKALCRALSVSEPSFYIHDGILNLISHFHDINIYSLMRATFGNHTDNLKARFGQNRCVCDYLDYEKNVNHTPGDARLLVSNSTVLFHDALNNRYKTAAGDVASMLQQLVQVRPDLNGKSCDYWLSQLNNAQENHHIPPTVTTTIAGP